jgi:dTMP kinase
MLSPNSPGFLLVIEGVDGAGKSTVVQKLLEHCRERAIPCVASKEPTDGAWGRRLRESAQSGRLSLEEELELFLKDRAEHVEQLIRPALEAGKVVILDRYYLSTAAYQGASMQPGRRMRLRSAASRSSSGALPQGHPKGWTPNGVLRFLRFLLLGSTGEPLGVHALVN